MQVSLLLTTSSQPHLQLISAPVCHLSCTITYQSKAKHMGPPQKHLCTQPSRPCAHSLPPCLFAEVGMCLPSFPNAADAPLYSCNDLLCALMRAAHMQLDTPTNATSTHATQHVRWHSCQARTSEPSPHTCMQPQPR